jgi:putative transposase
MRRRDRQLEMRFSTWGGCRAGAGRKPASGRRSVPHQRRPVHKSRFPVHVTLRGVCGLPSFRGDALFAPLRTALTRASTMTFRVLHFSVQADHLHLVVEAERSSLSRGVQGLAIRAAKAINRTLRRRGKVWSDRFHAHPLRTPREVRNAFVYVLANVKKHIPGTKGMDPRSSARWFDGWRRVVADPEKPSSVARARTWLARVGWRQHGLIDVEEAPRAG